MKKRKTGNTTAVVATSTNTTPDEVPNFLEIECLRDAYLAFVESKRREKREHRERLANQQNRTAPEANQPATVITPPHTIFAELKLMNEGRTEKPKSVSSGSPSPTHTSTSSSPSHDLESKLSTQVSPSTSTSSTSPCPTENFERQVAIPVKVFGKSLLTNTGYRNGSVNFSQSMLPTQTQGQFSEQPIALPQTQFPTQPQMTFLTPGQLQAQIQFQLQSMAQTQAYFQAQLEAYSPTRFLTQALYQTQTSLPALHQTQPVTTVHPFAHPLGFRFFQPPTAQNQPQAVQAILPPSTVLPSLPAQPANLGFFQANDAMRNEIQRQLLVRQMYTYGNQLNATLNKNGFQ